MNFVVWRELSTDKLCIQCGSASYRSALPSLPANKCYNRKSHVAAPAATAVYCFRREQGGLLSVEEASTGKRPLRAFPSIRDPEGQAWRGSLSAISIHIARLRSPCWRARHDAVLRDPMLACGAVVSRRLPASARPPALPVYACPIAPRTWAAYTI